MGSPTARTNGADFFSPASEMGRRMRDFDWSQTPLGAPATWPQSLSTAVQIMLASRYAMWMGWGPELTFFYNDAYRPTLGTKHPWALGRSSREVWREIWNDIGPRIEEVLTTGRATYDQDLPLILHRSGYPEETFHTFSYSPLLDEDGGIGGHLCVVIEDTDRFIAERRLRTLHEIAARIANQQTAVSLFAAVSEGLATNQRDLPFTLVYLLDSSGESAELACAAGIHANHRAAPRKLPLDAADWPIKRACAESTAVVVDDLLARFDDLPTGPWDIPPRRAIVVPIAEQAQSQMAGVMIIGLNPYRPLDDAYRGFIDLLAGQIAAGLADVRAYEREKRRAEALAAIDRAKTVFFSNASHEFRTPLTLMLGPLEDILRRGDRTGMLAVAREQIELMQRNGLRLLKLVNTLLDFSRLEADRMQALYEPIDLAAFTTELASTFRSAMDKAGLRYVIDCEPVTRPTFVDRDMWEKIVLNLLSNAFKYTPQGEVEVSLRESGDHAELRVRDTGVGIPARELPRLFERFHRVEGQQGRTHEGTGIGLALVRELVHLHGGTVEVTSAPGEGSCFAVSIPLDKAHLPAAALGEARATPSPSGRAEAFVEEALRWLPPQEQLRPEIEDRADPLDQVATAMTAGERPFVLVADDNLDMRDYLRRLLSKRYEVQTAVNGEEALAAARLRRPDLILADVMMPRLDGLGLLRAVRADPGLGDVPVVFLSARAGEEASIEGIEAGADDYLLKPFSARELLARLRTNIALAAERRRVARIVQDSERRLRSIFAEASVGIAQTDLQGRYVLVNRKYCEIVGRSMQELLGKRLIDLTYPKDVSRFNELLDRMFETGRPFTIEVRKVRPDGSLSWISNSVSLLDGAEGKPQYVVLIVQDINDRRAAEDALRRLNDTLEERVSVEIKERMRVEQAFHQAQKMEIIGQFTGGVAHDFNNLLHVIMGNLDALRRRLTSSSDFPAVEELLRLADAAARGGQRAATLTQRLLAFARKQPLKPETLDVNRLVGGMLGLLRTMVGENIQVELLPAADLWRVSADHNQLESAILNLAVNARDAMPDGGKITIATANLRSDDQGSVEPPELPPGQYVMIAVTDIGVGMSKQVLDRAFDPFFTTKELGQGTGLGLSQVYGFVKQSGGHVKVYSEEGQGTTVRLYLPRLPTGRE